MSSTSQMVDVRQPTIADAADIARLAVELGYGSEIDLARSRLAAVLDLPTHFVAVAERSGTVVGWVHAEHRLSLESGDRAELVGLVVATAVRRNGVGQMLVAVAERWAAARGLDTIVVRSNAIRAESHPFYRRIGFVHSKTQHVYAKTLRARNGA